MHASQEKILQLMINYDITITCTTTGNTILLHYIYVIATCTTNINLTIDDINCDKSNIITTIAEQQQQIVLR